MNWQLLLPLLITSVITIFGWYFVHTLTRNRDVLNKQKELRVNYLIEIWRKLNHVANRQTANETQRKEIVFLLEKVVSDIQLFGSPRQIELTKALMTTLKAEGKVSLDDLLDDLRCNLREELKLEKIEGRVHFFRVIS